MEFIWKIDLNKPNETNLRDFFIEELANFLPDQNFISEDYITSNYRYPFSNANNQPSQEELKQAASVWHRWSSQVIHNARAKRIIEQQHAVTIEREEYGEMRTIELNLKVKDIFSRFTRYEGKRFIILMLDVTSVTHNEQTLDSIFELQKFANAALYQLFGHLGNATFRVTDKFEEFKEMMQIMNPVPILPLECIPKFNNRQNASANWVDGVKYTRLTRKRYLTKETITDDKNKKIDQYVRERENLYFIDHNNMKKEFVGPHRTNSGEIHVERNDFVDRFHTEMLFFIRGEYYEKELSPLFKQVKFLNRVSKFMNSHWGRIRALYAITPKFAALGNNASARIMFFLLEVNAHYLSLQTKIKYSFDTLDKRLDEQLERPMFNLEPESNDSERAYYEELKNSAKKSFDIYAEKRRQTQEFGNLIDQNIQKLHGDFDSKSNMVLQSLVFIFSLIFVFWGAYELWLDKVFKTINYTTLQEIWSFVGWSLGGLGVLFLIYLGISKFFLTATSFSFSSDAKKQIKHWMSYCQPEYDFGANVEKSEGCIDVAGLVKNEQELRTTVMTKLKSAETLSDAMEVALQFVSLTVIGVAMGQLDASTTEKLLDDVSDELHEKRVK